MEETNKPQSDQDPAPLKDSDAERVTGKEADTKPEADRSGGERDGTSAGGDDA